ncbi:hypothetical protein C1645_872522 [Glomus cerebriforme]|uniref:Uncharacterized protein n=1 Tax=Glomus cerebriforme TaxID=658196 RepID=A0A397TEK8_9GLOM|nr:hypothetical protein C1645_872522 [Glomus cerebriforme]
MSTGNNNNIKFFKLSFKEDDSLKLYYVKSIWKVDSLKNLSGLDGKIVCELIVTNCNSFWTRDVTLGDLKSVKPNNIRVEKIFCEATYAALSGLESYENRKLSCQITINEDNNNAEFSWNWTMDETETSSMALKFTLGTLPLYPISRSETVKMWQEWMNFFIEERNQSVINIDNYETRIDDLSETTDQMKGKIETMIADKDNSQKNLTGKFKKVLNKKKRKVKKIINILNANEETTAPSNEPLESANVSEEDVDHFSDDEPSDKIESPRRPREKSQSPKSPKSQKSQKSPKSPKSSKSKRTSLPSKKIKLGKTVESNEDESTEQNEQREKQEKQEKQQPQESESVLTKTFRGQVIKSRRLRKSTSTLDDILEKEKDNNSSQDPSSSKSSKSSKKSKK